MSSDVVAEAEVIESEEHVVEEQEQLVADVAVADVDDSVDVEDAADESSDEHDDIFAEPNFKPILEAALFAAGEPLTIEKLAQVFPMRYRPKKPELREILESMQQDCAERGVELVEVASGYRYQAKAEFSPWMSRLWEKKPPRYSRALFETLALIAYQQPITRGEIEHVRGVAVSTNITKVLMDRDWIKIVGYKDVPGKPALFATTKAFLDYFGLKSLSDLPPLSELVDIEKAAEKLNLELPLDDLPPIENSNSEEEFDIELALQNAEIDIELAVEE